MEKGSSIWRKLNFLQREGKAPLPEAAQLNDLTPEFRINLWKVIDFYLHESFFIENGKVISRNNDIGAMFWQSFVQSLAMDVLGKPHDEISINSNFRKILRDLIGKEKCHNVLAVVECMIRQEYINPNFNYDLRECFKQSACAYFIDDGNPPCILPSSSKENMEQMERALENINNADLPGAKAHIRDAAEQLRQSNFPKSIWESISAVESAVRVIASDDSKNFSKSATTLKNKKVVEHPALIEAFDKLYGYTCDEQGIRHALLDQESANVGFDEAIFMYTACVAFVDFLNSKNQQLQKS